MVEIFPRHHGWMLSSYDELHSIYGAFMAHPLYCMLFPHLVHSPSGSFIHSVIWQVFIGACYGPRILLAIGIHNEEHRYLCLQSIQSNGSWRVLINIQSEK